MPKTLHWSKITQSTNLDAMQARHSAPDCTVWAAEFQSAGRGQRGNRWESAACENLTFSILFKPTKVPAAGQFIITQVAALGVVEYLRTHGVEAKVKWPNDIYVGDRKICGMLIENILHGDRLSVSVCGIGLNILQREFPPELPNPTSLVLEKEHIAKDTDTALELSDVKEELPKVLAPVFALYGQIGEEGFAEALEAAYHAHLYRMGELHEFEETEYYTSPDRLGRIKGRIVGIEKGSSRLMVELPDGSLRKYFFKEIRYIL